jgi:hypothetical protein
MSARLSGPSSSLTLSTRPEHERLRDVFTFRHMAHQAQCSGLPHYLRRIAGVCTPIITLVLVACAPLEQRPLAEPKIEFREVQVRTPVPCFTEAERPVAPAPTPINLDTATTDQMAAAVAADNIARDRYERELEALFVQCSQGKPK